MTKVVEAIYTDGVFEPLETLHFPEKQRVRLIVQPVEDPTTTDRDAALQRFFDGVASMGFRLEGKLPKREELYDRF